MTNLADDYSLVEPSRNNQIPDALELAAAVLFKRWKVSILWLLRSGTLRFRDLKRGLGNVSAKVLTQQLRELERDELIRRIVAEPRSGRRVYAVTDAGKRVPAILDELASWGSRYHRHCPSTAARYGLARAGADYTFDGITRLPGEFLSAG